MMMTNQLEITQTQAKALATLLHELRPDWDPQGLLTAIHTARTKASNFELCAAAIRAAGTPSVRTPAVIGMDGPHWHPHQAKPPTEPQRVQAPGRCADCGGWHAVAAPCFPPEAERSRGRGAAAAWAAIGRPDRAAQAHDGDHQ